MNLDQIFAPGRDSEHYRDIMKIKPRAGEAGFFLSDDDPKASSAESANMKNICSCINQKHSRHFHEGGDFEHYWDITKMKHDGAVEAKFSCYNREPKAKSAYMEKLDELFHRQSRGTELDLLTLAPAEPLTAVSGETSDQTFAPGGDSKHSWDIMKMMRDGAVEAMFSCINRDPQASSAESAYMKAICSCIHQDDSSAATTAPLVSIPALADDRSAATTAPLVTIPALADDRSAVTTAPLVSIPAVAATSLAFDTLPVQIVSVTIGVIITVVLTRFINGPVKDFWDCIVSKIRQFLRRSSDRDQPKEEEKSINGSKPSVKSSTHVMNLTININMSPDRDQPVETSL